MTASTNFAELRRLTADIVSAHVANNAVAASDLTKLISSVYASLSALDVIPAGGPDLRPAVPVRTSVRPGYLVCLEDGRKHKALKRHLLAAHGLTPEAYRAKWNLPADYPMVTAEYSARRRAMAIQIGLGRSPGKASSAAEPAAPKGAAPAKGRRKKVGISVR